MRSYLFYGCMMILNIGHRPSEFQIQLLAVDVAQLKPNLNDKRTRERKKRIIEKATEGEKKISNTFLKNRYLYDIFSLAPVLTQ